MLTLPGRAGRQLLTLCCRSSSGIAACVPDISIRTFKGLDIRVVRSPHGVSASQVKNVMPSTGSPARTMSSRCSARTATNSRR